MFDVALPAGQALVFLPLIVPIAVWAIYTDLKHMKILNTCVLALLAGFVILGPFAMPLDEYAWRFSHFAIVLVAGFILSSINVAGAGDAKFAAAMAPFIVASDAVLVMFLVATSAVALLIVHRIARRVPAIVSATPTWASWDTGDDRRSKQTFPYGLGLSTGLILYMLMGLTQSGASL